MSEERYEIIKLLGKGRTGGVYEAEDSRLNRKVAMRRFFSQNDLTNLTDYEEDFVGITQSLGALQHPNLLRVYDAGVDEDGAFIISQLLKGDTLHNRLKEGPLSAWDAWDLGHQLLDALSAAHDAGFVHGAITPGSLLMSPRARGGHLYVILDMGLCRLAPLIQGQDSILSMMADPAILAPELFDDSEADEKSDLYMLGNLIYMCLAGGHPFANKSIDECAELHAQGLPSITEYAPEVPEDFRLWMEQLCSVDPNHRPSSVVEALNSMPKVPRPARAASTVAMNAPGLATATGALGQTTAQLTGVLTGQATGPLTGVITGQATGPLSQQRVLSNSIAVPEKKSKKGMFIVLAGVALIGIIAAIALGGGDDESRSANSSKPETKTLSERQKNLEAFNKRMLEMEKANQKNKNSSPKPKKTPTDDPFAPDKLKETKESKAIEAIYSYSSSDPKNPSPFSQGWEVINFEKSHSFEAGSWKLLYANQLATGYKKRVHESPADLFFYTGWRVIYEVEPISGTHMVGLSIGEGQNNHYLTKKRRASFVLFINKDTNGITLSRWNGEGPSNQKKILNQKKLQIELRCQPKDSNGQVDVFVDGEKISEVSGQMIAKNKVPGGFSDHVFTGSIEGNQGIAIWRTYSLKLLQGVE